MVRLILFSVTLAVVSVCVWTDVREGKVFNKITFPAMGLGLGVHLLLNGMSGFLDSLAGLGMGLFLLFPCFMAGGVRAGDLKLLGAIGAWLGWRALVGTILGMAIVGMIHALILLLRRGRLLQELRTLAAVGVNTVLFRVRPSLPAKGEPYPYTLSILAGVLIVGMSGYLK